jgi:hypothetical protein
MGINGLVKNAAREPGACARARRNADQLATAPTALNPTSGEIRIEVFADDGARPAYGNPGRLIFVVDTGQLQLDTGAEWSTH